MEETRDLKELAERYEKLRREHDAMQRRFSRLVHGRARLEETDKLAVLATLASGAAHEINNPLTFIRANIEGLQQAFEEILRSLPHDGPWREEVPEILADITEGVDRIQGITEVLRKLAKNTDRHEVVELNQVVRDTLRFAQGTLRRRARVETDLGDVPPLRGNSNRLVHLVLSLVVRVVEAEDCPESRHGVRVITRPEDDHAVLELVDDRPLPDNVDSDVSMVSYLGLQVCRKIVEDHKGTFGIRAEEGKRTAYIIRLPTVLSSRDSLPAPRHASARRRLLFVDDEPLAIRSLRRLVRNRYELEGAPGGAEALAFLNEDSHFDAVLCDVSMPPPNGMQVLLALREQFPHLAMRFAFVTAGVSDPALRDLVEVSGVPLFAKPYDLEQVAAWIDSLPLLQPEGEGDAQSG